MKLLLQRFSTRAALLTAAGLLVAGILVAFYNEHLYSRQKIREVSVQADILASAVTAALSFKDHAVAQEYVDAMRANPEARLVAVYDAAGRLFASYVGDPETTVPETARLRGPAFERGDLVVTRPVTHGQDVLGMTLIRTVGEPLANRIARYAGLALLVTMASLVVIIFGAAQSALRIANRELEARAADLAATNDELNTQIREREKAEAALRQAQKMETIGQLTGGIAHDFNNLLTIVLGNLERLRRRLADGGDRLSLERAAENATHGAERAAVLTRSLLAFSRRQPLNPKPIDVNKLVANMSDLLRRTLGEQITIETVVAGGLWRAHADPNQLENAILNLAVNARDAMPEGGKLTIETANTYLDARYAAAQPEVVAGQYVVICVTDSGTGMTPEVMEKAFEPFFTTKDVGHGTGLGLSQVYGFIKQSGGHLKIYSEPGQGTTVKIYLPRLLAAEEPAGAADGGQPVLEGDRSETVLVVEDEDGVREHSVEILRELGYGVLEAATGRAALDILDRHPQIALLFTDVGLPDGMNGRQLANEACRRRPDLAVLFTTGYARNAIVHDGRLDPGVHLITKPFTYAELATALRTILDNRSGPPRILLVEDEILIRINTAETLGELGYTAEEAGTAAEAMRALRAAGGGIAAAIIDLGLPDRRGDDLAAEMRVFSGKLPIIIASGLAEQDVRDRFADDANVFFLDKPYDARTLEVALSVAGITVADLRRD